MNSAGGDGGNKNIRTAPINDGNRTHHRLNGADSPMLRKINKKRERERKKKIEDGPPLDSLTRE